MSMTVFVTFALGAKDAYFLNCPTHWARHNLPPDVETLFTKTPPIRDVLELTLGDNGAYFVSYRDSDGQIYCRHYNLPNPLITYLYHNHPHVIRDLSTLSITLGPYDSYYAHDKTSASWSNLPPLLEKALLARLESQDAWKTVWKEGGREAPCFVSLGADGTYFMKTVSGGGSWDLMKNKDAGEGMQGTNKFLDDVPNFGGVAGLYLFPQHPQSYVLLLTSGKAFSNLPEHTWADYNKMERALPPLVQSSSPIPAMPQARLQAQQQQPAPTQQHNISTYCSPAPVYATPYPPTYSQVPPAQPGYYFNGQPAVAGLAGNQWQSTPRQMPQGQAINNGAAYSPNTTLQPQPHVQPQNPQPPSATPLQYPLSTGGTTLSR